MSQDGIFAAIQMTSGDAVDANLATAGALLAEAAAGGARVALLPENFAFMGAHERDKLAIGEADSDGPVQQFLADTARRLKLWIIAGTAPLARPGDPGHLAPACLVYDDGGRRVARYDKIHLFDVDVPDGQGERYRESSTLAAGPYAPQCVDTPLGRLGLSVCYDLRFPELYRALSAAGAELMIVPAAFTVRTGRAHWETLLRARAIENQCYVIAAGQCGEHPGQRATWGHSMIIDPWGEVLATRDAAPGVVLAPISHERLRKLRNTFPVLRHRRDGAPSL